jgi:hypothetical protein
MERWTELDHHDSQACGWRICFLGLVPLVVMMDRYSPSIAAAPSMRGAGQYSSKREREGED